MSDEASTLAGDDILTNLLGIPWISRGIVPLSLSLLNELDLNGEQVLVQENSQNNCV
jgi:hypothetical protein